MSDTPADVKAKQESLRLRGLLIRFLRLPLPLLLFCFHLVKRLFVTPKLPAKLRAADKKRQSEVRRELRGLSPVHDPTSASRDDHGPRPA
jgi:hypothetical protein